MVRAMTPALAALAACLSLLPQAAADGGEDFATAVASCTVLHEPGGRASWCHSLNLIAFDKIGFDSYFDLCTIRPDGSELRPLTRDPDAGIPQANNGNPTWHPSGEFIVFQAEDPDLTGLPAGVLGKYLASPGIGLNNNLWLTTADGSRFWQLTHVQDRHGTLHPQFSPDGTKLLWSEFISAQLDGIGHCAMKLADFSVEDGEPALSNVRTLRPGDLQLYEVHGFSPDGEKIIFSAVPEGGYYYDFEVYLLNLATEQLIQLTDDDEWDEHAHFAPDGSWIMWVSTEGIEQFKAKSWQELSGHPPIFEYWVMRPDGSGKRCVSAFNNPEAPEYLPWPGGVGLGDFDWGPDGKTIVAKMRRGRTHELTALVEFDLEAFPTTDG